MHLSLIYFVPFLMVAVTIFLICQFTIKIMKDNGLEKNIDHVKRGRNYILIGVTIFFVCLFMWTGIRKQGRTIKAHALEPGQLTFEEPETEESNSRKILDKGDALQVEGSQKLNDFRKDHLND